MYLGNCLLVKVFFIITYPLISLRLCRFQRVNVKQTKPCVTSLLTTTKREVMSSLSQSWAMEMADGKPMFRVKIALYRVVISVDRCVAFLALQPKKTNIRQ